MIKKILSATLVLALVAIITMSYTYIASGENDSDSLDSVALTVDGDEDNRCCPPKWHLASVADHPTAAKWDRNGDGCICHKSINDGNNTPKGNGNEPEVNQSNVKDNNQPCKDGMDRCGGNPPPPPS